MGNYFYAQGYTAPLNDRIGPTIKLRLNFIPVLVICKYEADLKNLYHPDNIFPNISRWELLPAMLTTVISRFALKPNAAFLPALWYYMVNLNKIGQLALELCLLNSPIINAWEKILHFRGHVQSQLINMARIRTDLHFMPFLVTYQYNKNFWAIEVKDLFDNGKSILDMDEPLKVNHSTSSGGKMA